MDVLLHLTTPNAAAIAAPLGRALSAQGATWGCFLTNDGVMALADPDFLAVSASAARIAVCETSWEAHMTGQPCPVETGSQTNNSIMMAEAAKVVSL